MTIEFTRHHWGRGWPRVPFRIKRWTYPHPGINIAILTHPFGLWIRFGKRAVAFNWIP